ncbi:phage tail protein [Rhizobium mayense]|uniref:Phage tail protein n=1 Tax=Rhizobium mayense TaxID=1312184 RepID=A0ABT7JZA5_9HYPH|nr:phage tail protein [Rhizobium mayense]MDL2401252.1 phage tail protein [Rhizobium mayense]
MDFNEIPTDWLQPDTFAEISANYDQAGLLEYPQRVLMFAPRLAAGALKDTLIAQVTRANQAIAYLGDGSIGNEMVVYFKKGNSTTAFYIIAVDADVDAVAATGSFTFVGAVPSSTVLRFLVAGRDIRITALPTDTVANLATKLAAAINADSSNTVTATAALGVVTCTSRYGGEVGNDIDLRVNTDAQIVPTGLTITVADMHGGQGNPSIQPLLDAIANTWFTSVISPFSDATNMGLLEAWVAARYVATAKLDVQAYVAKRGTFGQLGTFGALTNTPFVSAMGLNRPKSNAFNIAAAVGALAAFHLTNDPARQLRSLVLPGIVAPDEIDQFEDTEKNLLLQTGISTFEHLPDGTTTISRLITTYKTTSLGVADRAWLDVMVPATMSRIRYDWASYTTLLYPRAKLVKDDSTAANSNSYDSDGNQDAVVTPKKMKATWTARCKLYEKRAWIQDVANTVKQSTFAISDSDKNRLEGRPLVNIVGNLMVFAQSLQFEA